MSQSTFEVTSVKVNQITANLSAAGSDSGAKRSLADSDDEESPAGKRFSTAEADANSNCELTADDAAPAADTSEKLGSNNDGGSSTEEMSQTVEHNIPDRLVGLMIGKGGESINRLQEESGARIQISTESSGSLRQVTLTGTPEQVERARQLMDTIVQNAERGSGDSASHGTGGGGGGGGSSGGAGQETITMQVPTPKVGLLIGKAGETIKSLQDKAGVRMLLVQDATTAALPEKPLKIIGSPDRLTYARELVLELLNSKDAREFPPSQRSGSGGGGAGSVGGFDMRSGSARGGGGGGNGGGSMNIGGNFGETYQEVKVPRRCVGVVIGKGGDMLRKINQETGAKVQFRQEGQADRELPERMLQVSGTNQAVQQALERVQHLISAVMSGEIPVTERPRGPESRTVTYAVPAEKAGLVIGKGGETVKEINRMSGAYVAIQRDAPPNGTTKVFDVQGSPAQIAEAIRLICEKAGLPHQAGGGGFYGNGGGGGDALAQPGQDTLPAPQFNSQTGQLDYSMAWAEYYRRQGMHEYADAILRQASQQQPQQPQQQQQPQDWQQWQQWQAWQQNGSQQQQAQPQQGQPQQGQQQPGGQQPQQQGQAWAGWQQAAGGGGGGGGAGWDQSTEPGQQAAAWGQQGQQQPDGGQQQQNWWYATSSGGR